MIETARDRYRRIAVIEPNDSSLSAVLVQGYFFCALRKSFPHAHIRVFSLHDTARFFTDLSLAHSFEIYEKNTAALLTGLRAFAPDLVINLRPQSASLAPLYALMRRERECVGFATDPILRMSLTKSIPLTFTRYMGHQYTDILSLLAIHCEELALTSLFRSIGGAPAQGSRKPYFLCMPCGIERYTQWPLDRYISLAAHLHREYPRSEMHFVLGPHEKGALPILEKSRVVQRIHCPSLRELIALVRDAQVIVTNDCGPAHAALLCRTPTVQIWSEPSPGERTFTERLRQWSWPGDTLRIVSSMAGQPVEYIPEDAVLRQVWDVLDDSE